MLSFLTFLPILAAIPAARLLYAIPLIVVVSLVYAATRHERWAPILEHAWDTALWIIGFMAVVFVVLMAVTWWF
ncbi:hypothetical protein LOC68_15935 [Blastopirellula sp. JC732]|uniref:Uncharacterized protein n=1 Tax=Blastopirellula sediminis TaxID=2894196 RepID=A0A9X1MNM1_9BACT|nr:hypothetical protein [Blastopirellula sediminis]MCC9606822.1 hypothetical protein [Blastopirellula sediminis]MCC9629881.1 hypothetical protein [Blastopirellula sediminis]